MECWQLGGWNWTEFWQLNELDHFFEQNSQFQPPTMTFQKSFIWFFKTTLLLQNGVGWNWLELAGIGQ